MLDPHNPLMRIQPIKILRGKEGLVLQVRKRNINRDGRLGLEAQRFVLDYVLDG